MLAVPPLYLCFEFFGLKIHFFQVLRQPGEQVAHHARQAVLSIFQYLRDAFVYGAYPLRDDNTEFG